MDRGYSWDWPHPLCVTKADLLVSFAMSKLPKSKTNTEPPVWHHFPGRSVAVWIIEPLPSWRWQRAVLTGIDTYSGSGFVILACNTSASTTIHVLLKCLIPHHGIPHNIASNQGIHFSAKEVQQWTQAHGIHSYYIARQPETTDPKESWNELLEPQLWFQLGDDPLKKNRVCLTECNMYFDSVTNIWCYIEIRASQVAQWSRIHLQCRRHRFDTWVRKIIPWRRKWQPTSVFLPGKSHGQRNLEGYSPRSP